jgi:hypothetical protein
VSIRAPFLIAVALGDGTEAEIPAAGEAGLERLLGRMADACARNRCRFPLPSPPRRPVAEREDRSSRKPEFHPPPSDLSR